MIKPANTIKQLSHTTTLSPAVTQLDPQLVVTSTLQRARTTAEIAGLHVDATDDDLREIMQGDWEGRYVDEALNHIIDQRLTTPGSLTVFEFPKASSLSAGKAQIKHLNWVPELG
ncbi:histidine phosphatase family protein [Corynebacterium cystitidis]|uniref:histidine phosphatase family protein n=1 Tax=Corynebacterium cystitidis TaxID=35757 RepID=UPI00211F0B8A|nr:histidine phosphatase family protein [Corynebacterium cystitidis]